MTTDRFTYEGRHLREWMLQLVEEEPERRLAAGRVILNLFSRPVELMTNSEWTFEQLEAEFQGLLVKTLKEPGFPHAEYVRKLVSLKAALSLKAEVEPGNSPHHGKKITEYLPNEELVTSMAINQVIENLGEELLPAAAELRRVLSDQGQRYIAANAIAQMGAKAIEFYPDLMEGLEQPDLNGEYPMPLGLLLRHCPDRVPLIVEMTGRADDTLRRNAIATLGYCGWETIQKFPEIESMARERLKTSTGQDWLVWARMLGETAVTAETVSLFLEETRSREDWHVGTAIDCLGEIGRDSERVVPRLIELLDEFEEYDSDWGWSGGEYARIIAALEKHGAAAKAAIPRLAQLIWSKPSENLWGELMPRYPNEGVIEFLGKFGTEAREALPELLEMKAEMQGRPMTARDEIGNEVQVHPDDRCPDYVQETIAKIEGKP